MSKKVSFSSDVKTFDGQSDHHLLKYAKLCVDYFDNKVKTPKDILSVVQDRHLLDVFIKEALVTKGKLEKIKDIESQMEKEERLQMIQKNLDEYDPFWDTPIWRMRSDKHKKIKVPILRMGCRDKNLSHCLEYQHLKWFMGFIQLLHNTDQILFWREISNKDVIA